MPRSKPKRGTTTRATNRRTMPVMTPYWREVELKVRVAPLLVRSKKPNLGDSSKSTSLVSAEAKAARKTTSTTAMTFILIGS